MLARSVPSLLRAGSALALILVIAACTPGGQFDPTEVLSTDIFNTKKKIPGEREPLFPSGVPGVENGVPQDLVKGYVPPPEPANTGDAAAANPAAKTAAKPGARTAAVELEPKPKPKPKPKAKPKPKVARAPATPPHDAAFDQKPAAPGGQSAWPNPPSGGQSQIPSQAGQTNWPAPPGGQVQTNWPPPPQTGQAQQSAQPGQSIWPNPPSTH